MVVYLLLLLFECDYNTTQAWALTFALAWPWVWQNLVSQKPCSLKKIIKSV